MLDDETTDTTSEIVYEAARLVQASCLTDAMDADDYRAPVTFFSEARAAAAREDASKRRAEAI